MLSYRYDATHGAVTRLDATTPSRAALWFVDSIYTYPKVDRRQAESVRPGVGRQWSSSDGLKTSGPILVVDDDVAIREIISETLEFEGYPVEQAANGAEALIKIEAQLPCLLLLDMRMPVLDGWGLVIKLRQRGLFVPTVVMTAARNAKTWANEIGAATYLDKPFEDTELLDVVERFYPTSPNR